MKHVGMIALGVVMLAACAPMNTSNTSTSSMGMSMSGTSSQSSDDSMSGASMTGTSTVAVTLPTPTVATSAPVNNGTGFQSGTFPLTRQATAPASVNPTGTLVITATEGQTQSNVTLSGLAPTTYYVAHYHVQGTASADPCTSGGAPIMESKIVGQSDGNGNLILNGTVSANLIKSATYFNVHTASDATGTPADNGVICSPVH